jgi:hypothetical protein
MAFKAQASQGADNFKARAVKRRHLRPVGIQGAGIKNKHFQAFQGLDFQGGANDQERRNVQGQGVSGQEHFKAQGIFKAGRRSKSAGISTPQTSQGAAFQAQASQGLGISRASLKAGRAAGRLPGGGHLRRRLHGGASIQGAGRLKAQKRHSNSREPGISRAGNIQNAGISRAFSGAGFKAEAVQGWASQTQSI